MNITTISYSESHEQFSDFGLKLWRKAGLEAELQEGDTPEQALSELKSKVRSMLQPELVPISEALLPVEQVKKEPKEAAIDSQIEAINSCTSQKAVAIFKKLVDRENDERLRDAYNKKLNYFMLNGTD